MESGLGSNPRSPTSPRYSLGASCVWALFTVVQKTGPSSHGPCIPSDDRRGTGKPTKYFQTARKALKGETATECCDRGWPVGHRQR